MVRRSHVVPGSIACCPWWTLGGGALVAAAAVTLSGGPPRPVVGAELDERARRSVEVLAAESEVEEGDTEVEDRDVDEGAEAPGPLDAPPRSVPRAEDDRATPARPRSDAVVPTPGFPESFSVTRPIEEAALQSGPAPALDAR
jgi:hypothetical protein